MSTKNTDREAMRNEIARAGVMSASSLRQHLRSLNFKVPSGPIEKFERFLGELGGIEPLPAQVKQDQEASAAQAVADASCGCVVHRDERRGEYYTVETMCAEHSVEWTRCHLAAVASASHVARQEAAV
jgi:hypothetical protein